MRRDDIRNLHRAVGTVGFVNVLADLLEGKDGQTGKSVPKLKPGDVSIRALWEGLVGPCEDTLPGYMRASSRFNYLEIQEAVDSTAFPSATGVLIAAKVIEAYQMTAQIGDQLVTTMPSKLKQERIVGFTSLEGPTEVPEGTPYQESGFTEKFVTTDTAKKGRILEVTEEAIFFDQTGQILMRAQRLGEMTAEERELIILAGVIDVGSGAAGYKDVYRPSGSVATLYSGANYYSSAALALADWRDVDTVLQYVALNIKDDRAIVAERLPIVFNPKMILTSRKMAAKAARIIAATTVRTGNTATTGGTQDVGPNPLGSIAPGLGAVASPLLDFLATQTGSRYTQSDDWFIGDPQRQFIWQEIWPLQTLRSRQDDEAAFRRDVVARFKVRYFGGVAALDNKYFIKVRGL